jgi:signal recognition particle subunit SRP54
MGDMLTLIEKAEAVFDQDQAAELERKIRQSTFDLEDFLGQLQQIKRMGPISQVLEMIPGMSAMKGKVNTDDLDNNRLKRVEAIIYSMTPEERHNPDVIGGSRRRRIAQGSGTKPQDVNQLLNQFRQMQKMMKQFTSGGKSNRQMKRMVRQQQQQRPGADAFRF